MSHYPDSSFLVSCYVRDANTRAAKACLNRIQAPLAFTALHALEVGNAFKLGVFRGLLTPNDAAAAWSNLEADLRSGRLVKAAVTWPVAFRVAAHLSERHSVTVGTRSPGHSAHRIGESDSGQRVALFRCASAKPWAIGGLGGGPMKYHSSRWVLHST